MTSLNSLVPNSGRRRRGQTAVIMPLANRPFIRVRELQKGETMTECAPMWRLLRRGVG